jgi:hypothetical protein
MQNPIPTRKEKEREREIQKNEMISNSQKAI